jgi:hypothetical protein
MYGIIGASAQPLHSPQQSRRSRKLGAAASAAADAASAEFPLDTRRAVLRLRDVASVQRLHVWSNGKVIMLLFGIMIIVLPLPLPLPLLLLLLLPQSAALLAGQRWLRLVAPRHHERGLHAVREPAALGAAASAAADAASAGFPLHTRQAVSRLSDAASVQCLRMWSNGKVIMLLFGIMVIAPLLPLLLPLSAALLVAPWRPWGVRWRSPPSPATTDDGNDAVQPTSLAPHRPTTTRRTRRPSWRCGYRLLLLNFCNTRLPFPSARHAATTTYYR